MDGHWGDAYAAAAAALSRVARLPMGHGDCAVRVVDAPAALLVDARVVAHRSVRGEVRAEAFLAQPNSVVERLLAGLPVLEGADHSWATHRLVDMAGIALAAFIANLGRGLARRLEPGLPRGEGAALAFAPRPVTPDRRAIQVSAASGAVGVGQVLLVADDRVIGDLLAPGAWRR